MVALVCAIAAAVVASLAYGVGAAHARAVKALASRRAAWGKPRSDVRESTGVTRYHDLQDERRTGVLAESDWRDLGLDAVYAHLDRAETFAGRARLHHRLRTPSTDLSALRRFDEVASLFERDASVRERVQTVLASADPYGQDAILEVLFSPLPRPSPLRHAFPVVAVLFVGALAAMSVSTAAGILTVTLAGVSIAVRVVHGRRMLGWIAAFRATSALLGIASKLGSLPIAALQPELAALRGARSKLATLARASAWLTIDTLRGNELGVAVIAYVNAFLLLDFMALNYGLGILARGRDDLRTLFEAVGDLDAALAVASFRAGAPAHRKPEIEPEATFLHIEDAVHPLLDDPVANSLHIEGRGVLITGPNMSGKSTFVRTIAINAVLAQAIYTTMARRYRAPLLRVRTLMNAVDDVRRGRSYYYAEVEVAKSLLQPSDPGTRTLVILDELFRGTNTSERIGAGKAVLAALHRMGHYVVASTHDRELVALLRDHFDPYHFGEHVQDGELVFPFELHRGPSTSRNAIALLRYAEFPHDVIADATEVTESLERGSALVVAENAQH
jgi:hypothetical protein